MDDLYSDHDLAVLSDWAADNAQQVQNPEWQRAYVMISQGADLLLRRRARSRETVGTSNVVEMNRLPAYMTESQLTEIKTAEAVVSGATGISFNATHILEGARA